VEAAWFGKAGEEGVVQDRLVRVCIVSPIDIVPDGYVSLRIGLGKSFGAFGHRHRLVWRWWVKRRERGLHVVESLQLRTGDECIGGGFIPAG